MALLVIRTFPEPSALNQKDDDVWITRQMMEIDEPKIKADYKNGG